MASTINSEVKIDYDRDTAPSQVLGKTAQGVNAVTETNLSAAKILGIQGRFINRLNSMRKGSVIAELEFYVDSTYNTAVNLTGLGRFIHEYIYSVEFTIDRAEILNREDVLNLRHRIINLAQGSDVKLIQAYLVPSEMDLANQILDFQEAVDGFNHDENCTYISEFGRIAFSKRKVTNRQNNVDILTIKTEPRVGRVNVAVRRPDLLGASMWEVRYKDRNVKMVIMDLEWLLDFRDKRKPIRTGSILDIDLFEKDEVGFDGKIIDTKYYIKKVHDLL